MARAAQMKENHGKDSPDRWVAVGRRSGGYLQGKPYPNERLMELGNPNWRRYWRENVHADYWGGRRQIDLRGADALFSDNTQYKLIWFGQWTAEGQPGVPDEPTSYYTGGQWRHDTWRADCREFILEAVPFFAGNGVGIIPNFGHMGTDPEWWADLDGMPNPPYAAMEEGGFVCPWGGDGKSFKFWEWERKLAPFAALRHTKALMTNHAGPFAGTGLAAMDTPDANGMTGWDGLWFSLTSFLLCFDDVSRNGFLSFSIWSYGEYHYFDEFGPRYLHLGRALGPYEKRGQCHFREFEDGWVAANGTAADLTDLAVPRGSARVLAQRRVGSGSGRRLGVSALVGLGSRRETRLGSGAQRRSGACLPYPLRALEFRDTAGLPPEGERPGPQVRPRSISGGAMLPFRIRISRQSLAFGACILALAGAAAVAAEAKASRDAPPSREQRTRAEVGSLIQQAGRTQPDWWDSVPLEYPETLDLSLKRPPEGSPWDTQKNVGQYVWSVINENPGRWRQGAKFMDHVAKVNRERPQAREEAWNALGHIYAELLQDYARGAYFWRKGKSRNRVGLADCYWRLGCKEMAAEQLAEVTFDGDRYGAAIRLWADLGEPERALELAEATAQRGNPAGAYLSAGNVCRLLGRFEQAVKHYDQVLAVPADGNRDWKFQKDLAKAAIAAIQGIESLDLKRIPDGTYAGTSLSFAGDLTVSVTVAKGRIVDLRVTEHHDKQYYAAMTETPALILRRQSLRDIDATTGATVTSDAIVNATAKALAGARQAGRAQARPPRRE